MAFLGVSDLHEILPSRTDTMTTKERLDIFIDSLAAESLTMYQLAGLHQEPAASQPKLVYQDFELTNRNAVPVGELWTDARADSHISANVRENPASLQIRFGFKRVRPGDIYAPNLTIRPQDRIARLRDFEQERFLLINLRLESEGPPSDEPVVCRIRVFNKYLQDFEYVQPISHPLDNEKSTTIYLDLNKPTNWRSFIAAGNTWFGPQLRDQFNVITGVNLTFGRRGGTDGIDPCEATVVISNIGFSPTEENGSVGQP